MTSDQKRKIEETIWNFQPGTFQQFMLKFLPLYDSNYNGMIAVGGSVSGKTRAGTPDLLATGPKGEQYGCDCGTEERYWFPTRKISEWKPVEDAEKSLSKMAHPVELVLASSRPIPHNHPNAKTIIIQHFAGKTNCRILLFSSTDLATWIEARISDQKLSDLLKEFFPEVLEQQQLSTKVEVYKGTLEQMQELGVPAQNILGVLQSAGGAKSEKEVRELVHTSLLDDRDRFQTKIPDGEDPIRRVATRLPELSDPKGKLIQLSGTPKIGKTKLCQEAILQIGAEYRWFLTPLYERSKSEFVDMVRFALYSTFWSKEEAYAIVKGYQRSPRAKSTLNPGFQVIVIDDAHLLSSEQLRVLNWTVKDIKSLANPSSIGVIISTNRNLKAELSVLDLSLVAPRWNEIELGDLLKREKIKITDRSPKDYLAALKVQSGGHPLAAKFLAGNFPNREKLLIENFRTSGVMESELSQEVTDILYNDILKTADQQNFVQRLSILIGKAVPPVMESLRIGLNPQISPTVANLYEQIGPAVLDGTVTDGLQVSPTFKEVAKSRISKAEIDAIYRLVANVLVKPDGKLISSENVLDAISYFLLTGDIAHAAMWATMLLRSVDIDEATEAESDEEISEKESTPEQKMEFLLDRMTLLRVVKPSGKPIDDSSLWAVRFLMSSGYRQIGKPEEGARLLESIDLDAVAAHLKNGGSFEKVFNGIQEAAISSRFLFLSDAKDPDVTLNLYLDLLAERGVSPNLKGPSLSNMIAEQISRLQADRLEKLDFNRIAKKLYSLGLYEQFSKLAVKLGLKALSNPKLKEALSRPFDETTAEKVFSTIVKSSLRAHDKDNQGALDYLDAAERILSGDGKSENQMGAVYLQHKGDAFFNLKKFDEAKIAFRDSNQAETGDDPTVKSWNFFKIGILSKDPKEIEQNLMAAKEAFVRVKNYNFAGRSAGALAAHYLIQGDYENALQIGKELAGWYHVEKRTEAGPGLMLLGNNMLKASGSVRPLSEEEMGQLYDANLMYFDSISSEARPDSGGVITYQAMAMLAEKAGLKDIERGLLKNALESDISSENDRVCMVGAWYRLIAGSDPKNLTREGLGRFFENVTRSQPSRGDPMEPGFFKMIFKPFVDGAVRDSASWGKVCLDFSDALSVFRRTLDPDASEPWAIWQEYIRGLGLLGTGNRREALRVFEEATRMAMERKDWALAADLAFYPAFRLGGTYPSLREAAAAQYQQFVAYEKFGLNEETAIPFGENLAKFWDQDFRKISEKDLPINDHMVNVLRALKREGFKAKEMAPILVSSLLKAFDHPNAHREILKFTRTPPEDVLAMTMQGK